jgi:hypothetical protein
MMDGQRQTGDHLATFYEDVMSPFFKDYLNVHCININHTKVKGLNKRYIKLKVYFFVSQNGNI